MIITFSELFREALARWRRDRTVLLALVGPFVFLPLLAWLLLVIPPDIKAEMAQEEKAQIILTWLGANKHWLAMRIGVELFGWLAILALYLSRRHDDVAGLLREAVSLLPVFAAAVLLSWGLIALGALAFILPGLYIYGRVSLTGAIVAAEPGVGVTGAIARSIALTRGHGWQMFGYLALTVLAGQVIGAFMQGAADAAGDNPIVLALVAGLTAAALAATTLARLLMEVSLYRRLAAPRHRV